MSSTHAPGPPLWLLAELTYRCPLHCAFCYNPVDFAQHADELTTEEWLRVLREARALGAVQAGFSGGEPMLRDDVEVIVGEAHALGYYTNLLTSGIGLTDERLAALRAAGLDHIQLSFQDSTREVNDFLSHTRTFDLKQKVAREIKRHGYPMVMNCVIHRLNIEHIGRIIEMAAELGAEYLELANTQFYAWANVNRAHLLPTLAQLQEAERVTDEWRAKLAGKMRIFYVVPDYHEKRPKKCVNGWGNTLLTIAPDGAALPCHTARMLPGPAFPNVRSHDLRHIWLESEGFNRYRGDAWMKPGCRSCPDKEKDLAGCRCQAYMLTGDPANADPVCRSSPHHAVVQAAVRSAEAAVSPVQPLIFRDPANSRRLARPF